MGGGRCAEWPNRSVFQNLQSNPADAQMRTVGPHYELVRLKVWGPGRSNWIAQLCGSVGLDRSRLNLFANGLFANVRKGEITFVCG